MSKAAGERAPGGRSATARSDIIVSETGIGTGTSVRTLDGAIPVEFLAPGDRVITRSGARLLRRLGLREVTGAVVRIRAGSLGHDRPGRTLVVAAGQPVRIADWRAQALYGAAQALVPVGRLADGEFVAHAPARSLRLFTLHFDAPEIYYAEGVEVLSGAPVPASV